MQNTDIIVKSGGNSKIPVKNSERRIFSGRIPGRNKKNMFLLMRQRSSVY